MASVNLTILVGRLGKDPELRKTTTGKAVCSFSVATSEQWTTNGQKQEHTEWHNVVVWGPQAEACGKYLTKGKEVYVEGSSRTRNYDDKDGNKRYITEIIANRVQFLGAPGGGREDSGSHRHEDVDNTFA